MSCLYMDCIWSPSQLTAANHFSLKPKLWMLAVLVFMGTSPSHAVPSKFVSLVQVAESSHYADALLNNRFERQKYVGAGAAVRFEPWEWNAQKNAWDYVVQPGESWVWVLMDTKTGYRLATYGVQYVGGENYCWSDGVCQPYNFLSVAWYLKCMPENDRYRVEVYHDNVLLGGDYFVPTPFQPRILSFGVTPEEISPDLPETQQDQSVRSYMPAVPAGETMVYMQLVDDLGCGVPIQQATVRLSNNIVAHSGSHLHFNDPSEPGTGKYVSFTSPGSTISEDGTEIDTSTDNNGQMTAIYRAGVYGVEEIITADVEYPKTGFKERGTANVTIRVPRLVSLDTSGSYYTLSGTYQASTTCNDQAHNEGALVRRSHYVIPYVYGRIRDVSRMFNDDTGIVLSLNDATLEYGGIFDSGDNSDRNRRCHWTHREGVDIDVNVGGGSGCPHPYNLNCALGLANYPQNTTRRQFLDDIVDNFGGYKWMENTLHYRFQPPND